jgi:hypothetical protein
VPAYWKFESTSFPQRVQCEPDFGGESHDVPERVIAADLLYEELGARAPGRGGLAPNPGASSELRCFTREHTERSIAFLIDQPYARVIDVWGFIGHVRFHNVDSHDRRAALAIGIEDPARLDRGLGAEALRLALGFGVRNRPTQGVSAKRH